MTTTTAYAWAPITKVEQQDDGTLMVYGPLADAGLDRDKQRLNQQWLDRVVPAWMAEGANVREQHDPFKAAGVGVGLTKSIDGTHLLTACVVDPVSVKKCLPGPNGRPPVLRGFSVGIKDPQLAMGKADAPNGEIVGGYICEVSLVDRPSNPRSLFTVAKADGATTLAVVDGAELVERTDFGDEAVDEADPLLKFVSAAQRKKDAASGVAMPNGDFPIPDEGHLRSAIGHLGNYKGDKAAARKHIIARARALGLTKLLPDDWNVSKADQVLAELGQLDLRLVGEALLAKADTADITTAIEAIGLIARLIQSEAAGMAAGDLTEDREISYLLDAVRALKYFCACEQAETDSTDQSAGGSQAADDFDMNGDVILLADEPTPTTTDTPDATKVDTPAATKTQQADTTKAGTTVLTKAEFATMLEATVAKVTKAQEDRLTAVEAQLTKALAAPAPGGPVQSRTATTAGAPVVDQLRAQAQALLTKANAVARDDAALAAGYREQAERLLMKADS